MTASTDRGAPRASEAAADGPGARRGAGRVPDFFMVGHPKSGTTAMYELLRGHPQIFMPRMKEPRWFSPDQGAAAPGAQIPGPRPDLPRTLQEYLALFAPAAPGQIVGEASTSYLRSSVAAGLIARERPDARIIAILREPAGFLRSMQLELIQSHVESNQDLARALEQEDRIPPAADGTPRTRYSDRVRYVEQLRRYHEVFPPEQVLVLIYDDFRADNDATTRQVMRFLGVDDDVPLGPVEANPTVHLRSVGADRAVARLQGAQGPAARAVKDGLKAMGLDRPLRRLRRRLLYAPPEQPPQEVMAELRRRFKPEVEALSGYLGRDLVALWGYDRVG